jgi:hypothetical protein
MQGVVNAKEEIMQAANYVRQPQSWTSYMDTAIRITGISNGTDWAELQRINSVLRATREAYSQFSYTQLSAGDMARMNQLGIQMMDLQQRSDALNASLQSIGAEYQDKVRTDETGAVSRVRLGHISNDEGDLDFDCNAGGHQLRIRACAQDMKAQQASRERYGSAMSAAADLTPFPNRSDKRCANAAFPVCRRILLRQRSAE